MYTGSVDRALIAFESPAGDRYDVIPVDNKILTISNGCILLLIENDFEMLTHKDRYAYDVLYEKDDTKIIEIQAGAYSIDGENFKTIDPNRLNELSLRDGEPLYFFGYYEDMKNCIPSYYRTSNTDVLVYYGEYDDEKYIITYSFKTSRFFVREIDTDKRILFGSRVGTAYVSPIVPCDVLYDIAIKHERRLSLLHSGNGDAKRYLRPERCNKIKRLRKGRTLILKHKFLSLNVQEYAMFLGVRFIPGFCEPISYYQSGGTIPDESKIKILSPNFV